MAPAHRNSSYANNHSFHSQAKNNKLRIKKALVVTKLTRYEFEKIRHSELDALELEEKIRCRGTDFDALMHYHNLHKAVEHKVVDCFRKSGVEVKIVNRLTINKDLLQWTDVLVPVGGDGTFLLAASRASPLFIENSVPIVGFNSDPQRSEGRLMLPKQYSSDVQGAVKKLLTGEFNWMHRSRIRITLLGVNGNAPIPVDLHEYNTAPVEHKEVIISEPTLLDHINGCANGNGKKKKFTKRMLPYLALNEVSHRLKHSQQLISVPVPCLFRRLSANVYFRLTMTHMKHLHLHSSYIRCPLSLLSSSLAFFLLRWK